ALGVLEFAVAVHGVPAGRDGRMVYPASQSFGMIEAPLAACGFARPRLQSRKRLARRGDSMSVKEAYPRLVDALGDVRRQWRLHKLLEGTLLLAAGVGLVLTLLIVADNLWQPGKAGRVLLASLLWGGLAAAILSLIVRRWLEDRRDDFFAALVERRHPELSNRLINALQLGRGTQGGVSRDLIDAIVRDADRSTADLDLGDSVDRRPTMRAGLWALAAVVLIGGYAVARPAA